MGTVAYASHQAEQGLFLPDATSKHSIALYLFFKYLCKIINKERTIVTKTMKFACSQVKKSRPIKNLVNCFVFRDLYIKLGSFVTKALADFTYQYN
jgi:hypothetical protein